MKVRDFIKINADIDVYDNVCEELGICFCGPMMLTKEGEEHFDVVLNFDIELDFSGEFKTASIDIDDEFFPDQWKWKLKKAEEFFYAAAGYCADEDYQKWFVDIDFGQYAIDPDAMMDMIVYCDTTPWYTEEEMNQDNLCEMSFPRKMVQEFYASRDGNILTFVQRITEEYTADDTDGLWAFCKDRGFIAVRED